MQNIKINSTPVKYILKLSNDTSHHRIISSLACIEDYVTPNLISNKCGQNVNRVLGIMCNVKFGAGLNVKWLMTGLYGEYRSYFLSISF